MGFALFTLTPNEAAVETVLRTFLLGILPAGIEVVRGQDNRVPEPSGSDFIVFWPLRRRRLSTNIDAFADAAYTASIAGTLMTVSAVQLGVVQPGAQVFGTGVAGGTQITSQVSGSTGGPGTYQVSVAQAIPAQVVASGVQDISQSVEITYQLDVHGPGSSDNAETITTLMRDDYAVEAFAALNPAVSPLHADDPRQMAFINEESQYEDRWIVEALIQAVQTLAVPQQAAAQLQVGLYRVT